MLFYADGEVRPILQAAPRIDRAATRALVERLYPGASIVDTDDGDLHGGSHPADGLVYAACLPGLTVVCTGETMIDRPSKLPDRFHAEAGGRTLYLHAMDSGIDWFSYAVWTPAGELRRALSLSPDSGVLDDIGERLPFEAPFWAGEPALPPRPSEMADGALRALFGFAYAGAHLSDDPDPRRVVLAGFAVGDGRFGAGCPIS